MADLGAVVAPLTFTWGAALAGSAAALLVRAWTRRGGRRPSLLEAGWCALLPLVAVLLLPLAASLQPHAFPQLHGAHDLWHRWEDVIHGSTAGHAVLHGANWLVVATGAGLLGRTIFALARMWSFEESLRRSARVEVTPGVYSLANARPLCFTLGLLRPAVYVTTVLQEQLPPSELRAMLAHEVAHVRRRDTVTSTALTLFYALIPVPGSGLLLRDWRLAVERACDREAARVVGSPFDVAAALVRVARLVAQGPERLPNSAHFADEDVEHRVLELLQVAGSPSSSGWAAGGLAAVSVGAVLTVALWLPHAVELFAHH